MKPTCPKIVKETMENCLFCDYKNDELIQDNSLCYARKDGYPVTRYHTLIIPRRHVASYFDLKDAEVIEMHRMLFETRNRIMEKDSSVTGFNVGINVGKTAGQSVFHVHMHVIPRRVGDIDNPQGGVRGVIPHMRTYRKTSK